MSNQTPEEPYDDVIIAAEDRPVRLPRDGGALWKTIMLVVLAASIAAGAITYGLQRDTDPAATAAPTPKPPVETPGVTAAAPAPRIMTPVTPPEQPKVQERLGEEPPSPLSPTPMVTPPRTAPFQITPESSDGGPRQIPLTPRVVQTTPITAPPPLSALPADEPSSAPTAAPLPKERPR